MQKKIKILGVKKMRKQNQVIVSLSYSY